MLLHTEGARSAAYFAAWAADAAPERLAEACGLACVAAGEAGVEVTGSAIQAHGGIGFTWEADVHWLFKRAQLDAALLGSGVAPPDRARAARGTVTRELGEVVARGTRSVVHAYGRGAVVKVPKPATPDDWMARNWIGFEAQYADAARAAGAPAPRLLGMESIDGRPASVWERIDGVTMWQEILDRPHHSAELGRRLADLQLALFELVAPVSLPSQHDRLATKIRLAAAKVDAGLARALDLIPERVGRLRLCHGDLHPGNVILGREGPVIIDWYDASRGDPTADVARTLVTLLGDGSAGPRHLPGSNSALLDPLTTAYLERLQEPLGSTTSGWDAGRRSTPSPAWPRAWHPARCSRSGSAARPRLRPRRAERATGSPRRSPVPRRGRGRRSRGTAARRPRRPRPR